mmetsp:Transcript_46053/g.85938  ORF Transcript_46053/g.85938 Transcript_46053/m.85938 type:complete len:349 (-) Transcript_46053:261-1307(-)
MAAIRRKLSAAFKASDPNETGFICCDDMSRVLKGLISMNDNLVDGVLQKYNKCGADSIEYADFLNWFLDEGATSGNSNMQSVYDIKEVLGSGAYGIVHAAKHRASGGVHAVKTIKLVNADEQVVNEEISIMRTLKHSNVIRFFDVFREAEAVHIAMEMCSGGTLLDRLVDNLGFSEPQAACVMQQIVSGVAHMHGLSICHRDLKPQNILFQEAGKLVEQGAIKIADFGLAKRFSANDVFTDPVGSPTYAAPEVLLGQYSNACDMWSCGVIAYVTLSVDPPFKGKNDVEVLAKVLEGQYEFAGPRWSTTSATAKDFVSGLMEFQPKLRYTAEQAVQHDWLRSFAYNTSA